MPHPPIYFGNQDDDRTRSIDIVHIEPSIREGVHLIPSLYGPEASLPLYRFPPVSSDNAWIRGNQIIPSVLIAEEGIWNASPTGYFEYQWMANGVDIPFATEKTWLSTTDYADQTITVEIRGINYMGQGITVSSGMIITVLQPIETREQENFLITGLNANGIFGAQTIFDERTILTSGISTENRQDVVRSVSYFTTGTSAENRHDINAMGFMTITGLQLDQNLTVNERDWGTVVINYPLTNPLIDSVPVIMNLKNSNAEMGLAGWDISGTVWWVTDDHHEGNVSWNGGENVGLSGTNTPYSYMWQDVPIESVWETDVDAGLCNIEMYWYQFSEVTQDMANMRIEYFDENMISLGQNTGPGLWASPNDIWFRRSLEDIIPSGTRTIRVFGEFNLQDGNNNDAGIDTITLFIRKGIKIVARDFGPTFEQWRIKALRANTWSGTGLSELEFRALSGGADLATGGTPIFGSAGYGVSNADFAFDDIRNTGYWAGEENGVTNGTAWIGYNMGVTSRPQAIDITARLGSDSLMVGREYMVQASDDGIRWTDIHYLPESRMGSFSSGQQKELLIPRGAYDWYRNYPGGDAYLYTRNFHGSDDYAGKGAVFESHCRMNIDELSVMIDDNQSTPFNFRLQLARLNNQKQGSGQNHGMVSEVLEDFTLSSPGINGGLTWITQICGSSHEFEVGDWFLLRFYDLDAATNPVDPNEGRTRWIESWNGGNTPYQNRHNATRIATWQRGGADIQIGHVNPTRIIDSNFYWALDFKGSIF